MSSLVVNYLRLGMLVWYNTSSLANILSLAAVRKLYRVTMDTVQGAAMHVHVPETNVISFAEMLNGIYCHNAESPNYCTHKLNNHVSAYSFVNKVAYKLNIHQTENKR